MKIIGSKNIMAVAVAAFAAIGLRAGVAAEAAPVSELAVTTHIHGLAVDRGDPSFLLMATHHGLYRAGPDGNSVRISEVQDFMGFSSHPSDPVLFGSGHPAGGGNLGFVTSRDGGKTWVQMSPGLDGPVDFHQLTISPADPRRIYGAYGGLQMSDDGGNTWTKSGSLPNKTIDLTASAKNPDTLYAATETGLFVSLDAGGTWKPILRGRPVTMVEATLPGLYAFVYGEGLMRASEGTFSWTSLGSDWGSDYLLHLAGDPNSAEHLYAATGDGVVLESMDGGETWSPFGQ